MGSNSSSLIPPCPLPCPRELGCLGGRWQLFPALPQTLLGPDLIHGLFNGACVPLVGHRHWGQRGGWEGLGALCLSLPPLPPSSAPLPCPPSPHCSLTTAVGFVGLQHVGRILGCPLPNEVAVLVLVVAGRAHHHRSLPGCLLLLPLGQLLGVPRWGTRAQGLTPTPPSWGAAGPQGLPGVTHLQPPFLLSLLGVPLLATTVGVQLFIGGCKLLGKKEMMGSRFHIHVLSHSSPPVWGTG